MNNNYFTKIPTDLIRNCNSSNPEISRKLFLVYSLIDRNRTREDNSYLTLAFILKHFGFTKFKRKTLAMNEVINIIKYLDQNQYITVGQDLDAASYKTLLEIKINTQVFDNPENFVRLNFSDLDKILNTDSSHNVENLLFVYLYIKSFIISRPKNITGKEKMLNPENHPEAFFRSLNDLPKEISISKDTLSDCLKTLVDIDLYKKSSSGFVRTKSGIQNLPNIYVLNKENYQQEIQWARNKMLEMYKVESLVPEKNITGSN